MAIARGAKAVGMAAGRELSERQAANKARKVAARKASKARRRANRKAWESSENWDIYDDVDQENIEWFFKDTKPTHTVRMTHAKLEKPNDFEPYLDFYPREYWWDVSASPEKINKLAPSVNRATMPGISKAFHPDDIQTISRVMEENHPVRISSFGRLDNNPLEKRISLRAQQKDLYINQFNRIMSELSQAGGDDAVFAFRRMLPDWPGSIPDLIALIRNTI